MNYLLQLNNELKEIKYHFDNETISFSGYVKLVSSLANMSQTYYKFDKSKRDESINLIFSNFLLLENKEDGLKIAKSSLMEDLYLDLENYLLLHYNL